MAMECLMCIDACVVVLAEPADRAAPTAHCGDANSGMGMAMGSSSRKRRRASGSGGGGTGDGSATISSSVSIAEVSALLSFSKC